MRYSCFYVPIILISGFVFCSLFLLSCHSGKKNGVVEELFTPSKFDDDDFSEQLEAVYTSSINEEEWNKKSIHSVYEAQQYVYQSNSFHPFWVTETGNTDFADALLNDLEPIENDGLNPSRYKAAALKELLTRFKEAKEMSADSVIALDTMFTKTYLKASRDLLLGMIRPSQVDSLWFHKNDTTWNATALLLKLMVTEEKYPSLDSFRSRIAAYKILQDARIHYKALIANKQFLSAKTSVAANKKTLDSLLVYIIKTELPFPAGSNDDTSEQGRAQILNSFQRYYGLNPTGKIDDRTLQYLLRIPDSILPILNANLERLRWMPQALADEHVIVDIPLFQLFLVRHGSNVMEMNVVVGKTIRQTPSLNSVMSNVVFNPPWGVPPTILKKDVLPGLQKRGKAYLHEKGLKIYDKNGNVVDASKVSISNYKQYSFRQAPGDDNALGYIKFYLANEHDIYLHDTPHREIFDWYDRAQSSGCVRVQKPKEMAEYILVEMDKQRYTMPVIDSMIRTQKTKYQRLERKIPVYIVYLTAFGNDGIGSLRFSRDIYKRDIKLMAALQ